MFGGVDGPCDLDTTTATGTVPVDHLLHPGTNYIRSLYMVGVVSMLVMTFMQRKKAVVVCVDSIHVR